MSSAAKIKVYGEVQGVGFRAWVARRALKLNLKGYVANEPDGSVTIVAEGSREAIEKLIEECRRGPPLAVIERVEIEWIQPIGSYEAFEVIYRDYELP